MKQVTFIVIAWLLSIPLMAQPTGNKFFIGGHFSLYGTVDKSKDGSTTEKDGSTTYFTVMPVGGYFLNDRLAIGAGVGFDLQIDKDPQSTIEKTTYTNMVLNPFGRYYLIYGQGGIFAEASMGFSFGKNKYFSDEATETENVFGFSALLSPGVYYYVTPKIAIEAKFGWFGFRSDVSGQGDDNRDIRNSFGIDLSPDSFIFGLTFIL